MSACRQVLHTYQSEPITDVVHKLLNGLSQDGLRTLIWRRSFSHSRYMTTAFDVEIHDQTIRDGYRTVCVTVRTHQLCTRKAEGPLGRAS